MSASVSWIHVCPICKGMMNVDILDKKNKKLISGEQCPICLGKGNILVKKVLERK